MKKKLKLNELTVQSFITELNDENAQTLKGGTLPTGEDCTLDCTLDRTCSYRPCMTVTIPPALCTTDYSLRSCPTLPVLECL